MPVAPPPAEHVAEPSVWVAPAEQCDSPELAGAAPQLPAPHVAEPLEAEVVVSEPELSVEAAELLEDDDEPEPPQAARPRAVEAARAMAFFRSMGGESSQKRPRRKTQSWVAQGAPGRQGRPAMSRPLSPLALLLTACACGGAPSAAPEPSHGGAPSSGYDVHEWGLVRAAAGDLLGAGAVAPPAMIVPLTVDKPVLYFHAAGPLTLERVAVHVADGCVREHWPITPQTDVCADLSWTRVTLDPTAACTPTPLPTDCGHLEGFCEVPGLAVTRTDDAACVTVAGGTDRFLFYSATARSFTPPLTFTRQADGSVVVANTGDHPIPGRIVRIESNLYQGVRALAVAPPPPHGEVTVGNDFAASADGDVDMPALPGSPEPGRAAVRDTFAALGLTTSEAEAFLRAWDAQLFQATPGPDVLADHRAVDTLSADETVDDATMAAASVESFLYFLPSEDVDGIATLDLDPPPAHVRRAMAIWTRLGTGTHR